MGIYYKQYKIRIRSLVGTSIKKIMIFAGLSCPDNNKNSEGNQET